MRKIVVAYGKYNREMGFNGGLPWGDDLRGDMEHVRSSTMGGTLIMGRVTYESIGKPLPGRDTIVVTRQGIVNPSVVAAKSLENALRSARREPVVLFGGVNIYNEAITNNLVDLIDATEVDGVFDADVYFPAVGPGWIETSRECHDSDADNKYPYDFVTYERVSTGDEV